MPWNPFRQEFKLTSQSQEDDPLFRRIRAHARKRLRFTEMESAEERLFACKEYLRLENEMLWRYHRKGDSGLRVAHAYAIMMDVLVQTLFDYSLIVYSKQEKRPPIKVSVLALGGYGRNELCPRSDVDIMFLCSGRTQAKTLKAFQQVLTDVILYPLWDCGLKVGYSTRTIKECIEEARTSMESKNAMLEARPITGSENLFDQFQSQYKQFYLGDSPQTYARTRLADQKDRRARYGNTVYMQQPNIKNGVGGLRDYQNILWMSFVRLNTGSLKEVEAKGYLSSQETALLIAAYDFLLRVRNELHFRSSRPTDVLDLESQPEIAWGLGYKQHDIFKRIEAFMHDYFRHASSIYQISNLLEQRLAVSNMPDREPISMRSVIESRQYVKREQFDGFLITEGVIGATSPATFREDPTRLIRVFRHAQKLKAKLSLELQVLIRENLPLIDNKVIHAEAANRSFRAILQTVGNVAPTLYQMHECGVLGRFIPEFGKLTCLVQHEYYHLYTADIHTLRTIEELDRVFSGEGDLVEKYQQAIRQTHIPALLYLMLLIHDLGKAEGIKGHAQAGVAIAEPILERLSVPEEHREQILFIIENHFEMARFTLNYDIDDPATAETFAKSLGNPDNLRYLYVHTFCDARGTSHELWNSYKDTLHRRLYSRTLEQFKGQDYIAEQQEREKLMIRDKLMQKTIPGIAREEIEAHFSLLPDRYFLNHAEEEIEQHLLMIHQLLAKISHADSLGSLEPVIEWHDDKDLGLTVVHVVTWDRAGLFYKLAGAFTLANLSILSSKIITREDHITIDTFYLVDPNGRMVDSKSVRENFQKIVREALLNGKDLTADIARKARSAHESLFTHQTERLRTNIPPIVDIYHELSLKRTIVEVQATDHIGLLYQIARAIFDAGFDINFARISTQRDAALDVFYIENINVGEPISTSRLLSLRNALEDILADPSSIKQQAS